MCLLAGLSLQYKSSIPGPWLINSNSNNKNERTINNRWLEGRKNVQQMIIRLLYCEMMMTDGHWQFNQRVAAVIDKPVQERAGHRDLVWSGEMESPYCVPRWSIPLSNGVTKRFTRLTRGPRPKPSTECVHQGDLDRSGLRVEKYSTTRCDTYRSNSFVACLWRILIELGNRFRRNDPLSAPVNVN